MPSKSITVSEYLKQKLALCGRTQREIAHDAGYVNSNVLSMFKQGKTKLPYGAIGRLAKAMGSDHAELLRIVMKEYDPELWATLEQTLAVQPICSANEAELLRLIVHAANGRPIDVEDPDNRREVRVLVRHLAACASINGRLAVHRLEQLPRNSPDRHS